MSCFSSVRITVNIALRVHRAGSTPWARRSARTAKYRSSRLGWCGSTAHQSHSFAGQAIDEIGHARQIVELDLDPALLTRVAVAGVRQHARPIADAIELGGVLGIEPHRVRGPVPVDQLVLRAGEQIGAGLEHHDLVGQTFGFDEQVRAHHHGASLARHLADEVQHGVRGLGIETRRRFVEQQQFRVVHHRAGQRQPRLHARRVAAHLLVERLEDAEASGG